MFELLDEPLFRALMDGTVPFYEVMNSFGIRVTIANLPPAVYGFTYVSRKGHYHLALNGNINYDTQCKVFIHEIKHIIKDMPKAGYIVGLDMHLQPFETEADKVAESCGRYNVRVG